MEFIHPGIYPRLLLQAKKREELFSDQITFPGMEKGEQTGSFAVEKLLRYPEIG